MAQIQSQMYGRGIPQHDKDISDIESTLENLTEEELLALWNDPQVADICEDPPSERCRYESGKTASAPFDKDKLAEFLEKQAKEEEDWEEAKPYVKGEKKGTLWTPKQTASQQDLRGSKARLPDDDDDNDMLALKNANEADLVECAAILNCPGLVTQDQYNSTLISVSAEKSRKRLQIKDDWRNEPGKLKTGARHPELKFFADDPFNNTDVEDSLNKVKSNDPGLKDLNLNNIKNISEERLIEFGNALTTNTNLEKLQLSNTGMTDRVALVIAESLKENTTLKVLNLESNRIGGESFVEIMKAVNVNKTLQELRISNQVQQVLGTVVEGEIADYIMENGTLLKFGAFLKCMDPRMRVQEYIQRNNENVRRARRGETLIEIPKRVEKPKRKRREPPPPAASQVSNENPEVNGTAEELHLEVEPPQVMNGDPKAWFGEERLKEMAEEHLELEGEGQQGLVEELVEQMEEAGLESEPQAVGNDETEESPDMQGESQDTSEEPTQNATPIEGED